MNKQISKKDLGIVIGLLGVVCAALTYYLVFNSYSEKTKALEKENASLKTKVAALQVLANDRENLENTCQKNKDEIALVLNRFPADVRAEDVILLAVNLQNTAPFQAISGITIGEDTEIYAVSGLEAKVQEAVAQQLGTTPAAEAPADAAATTEAPTIGAFAEATGEINYDGNYSLRERSAEITGTCTYEGFKQAIRMVIERNNRTQLSVMASYDQDTGLVDTQMTLSNNYMLGTGRIYQEPNIPFVVQGTSNIFGTVDLSNINEGQAATEAAGAE